MRAVLDVNVLVSVLLSRDGAPARLLLAWRRGTFDLIVSQLLVEELRRALTDPKLARLVPAADAQAFVAWLVREATTIPDPDGPPPVRSTDPGDDYLIGLAMSANAMLISGDGHLLALAGDLPIHAPAAFLDLLGRSTGER